MIGLCIVDCNGADSIWVKVQICVEKHSGRADVLWAEVQIVYLSDPRALLIVNKICKIAYFFVEGLENYWQNFGFKQFCQVEVNGLVRF
jgi:hypothetical protein